MSGRELPKPSPFIISKSILKHPSREVTSSSYTQSKHQNLRLYITKKHSELKARYGLSSRNHTIAYIVGQAPESQKEEPNQPLENQTTTFEETLDPITKKAYDNLIDQQPKDFFIVESKPTQKKVTKKRKTKLFSREQALRAYVYSSFTPEIVDQLYETYKGKQKEYAINKVRKASSVDVEALISRKGSTLEKPEDYFLDQTIRHQGVNASAILGVGELKTKDIDKKSPKTETEREIENIYEKFTHKEKSKLIDKKLDQQHVINLFRQATVGRLNANNIQLSRIRENLDRASGMYQIHEEFMKEKREKEIRESKVKFVRNENNIVKKIKEKSRVTLAKAISEYSKSRSPEFSPFPSHSPNKSENRVHDILKTITKKSPTEESPRRRGETGSINSMSSSALNLRSEFGNTSPLKLTTISDEQGLPQRSSSVPKLIRKNSMNTSIGIEGFDNSFQRTVKAVPYPFGNIAAKKAKFRERGRTKSELSHSTERILASTAATNRMQSTEDRFPIHQEEKSKMSMSQTSMTYAENSGQTHNVARTTFNQTRFLSSKRNVSPMMKTVTSQSTKTMYSHRGSFSFGRRKNVDPLAELKESFQAFQTQTENFFEHSERERRLLDAKISKTIKETEKNFKKMEKTSSSIPEINTDEMIHFANQRLFKKELVSKIVASIEDKEDALQAIQKKRFIAEMSKEVLRNLGK